MIGWIPPSKNAPLLDRVFGADPGGGNPSVFVRLARSNGSAAWTPRELMGHDYRWQDIYHPGNLHALVLALNKGPCSLSMARACTLHDVMTVKSDENEPHPTGWLWHVMSRPDGPTALLGILIERIGGQTVFFNEDEGTELLSAEAFPS